MAVAAGVVLNDALLQDFGLAHTGGDQADKHLTGNPAVEALIGAAQEVHHHAPLFLVRAGERFARRLPLLVHRLQALELEKVPKAVGDGGNQFPFFFQERAEIRGGHFTHVENFHLAHEPIFDDDVRRLRPRGGFKLRRGVSTAVELQPRCTDVRVLPARRDGAHDLFENLVRGGDEVAQQLFDPVQTVEFLGALLQRPQQLVNRPGLIRHDR